jgi:hypothetical protein
MQHRIADDAFYACRQFTGIVAVSKIESTAFRLVYTCTILRTISSTICIQTEYEYNSIPITMVSVHISDKLLSHYLLHVFCGNYRCRNDDVFGKPHFQGVVGSQTNLPNREAGGRRRRRRHCRPAKATKHLCRIGPGGTKYIQSIETTCLVHYSMSILFRSPSAST